VAFDFVKGSQKIAADPVPNEVIERWQKKLLEEGRAAKAQYSGKKALESADIEALARKVFDEVSGQAAANGVKLGDEDLLMLLGDLSGLGPLLELISRPDVEDVAINLGHIYVFTTTKGWEYVGPTTPGMGDAIRVLIDRAHQIAPTPDHPIADAMLQVMVPTANGVIRKGIRINFMMEPASPYGDTITLRVSNYRTGADLKGGSLDMLCTSRLPAVPRPAYSPRNFHTGDGVLTPEAANYLLSIMVNGGTLILAGATGSGKTFVANRVLQEMLDFFPKGAIRLFIIEDSNEIVLHGWDGSRTTDTGNIIYTVTRPEIRGGPPPVTMYDLVRAALRSRPHGLIIGEARGPEAWELIRAAATGHGHSAFTIHATSAEHVWHRFIQVVRAHPDVANLADFDIAYNFAEAVTAIAYIERSPLYGQVVREIVEVSPIVERSANRPSFSPIFRYDVEKRKLLPTGNRPMRPGYRAMELGLPDSYFINSH
jgi:type IV secretory pathway ATPase VirB11/archaellum biosynthesis ATPase